jgi:hypothetical protein
LNLRFTRNKRAEAAGYAKEMIDGILAGEKITMLDKFFTGYLT